MPFVNADFGPSTRPILQHHKGIPAFRPATHTNRNGGSRLSRLGPEPDEAAVVSLVGRRGDDQEWHLVLGSVLIGPDPMTGLSWHEWLCTDSLRKQPWSLGVYGVEQRDWRTFDYQRDDWRYIRFSIPVRDLAGWLSHVMTAAEFVLPRGAPLRATVEAAEALLRVFRHVDTPTGLLAAAAGRPVLGWLHPVRPTVSGRKSRFFYLS